MKGVIFNLLETAVEAHFGPDMWDDLLDDAGLSGSYTSLGSYPDEEAEALVSAAMNRLGLDRSSVLKWFGASAIPALAITYPDFFVNHSSARTFVLGINNIIHAEVRKLYPGAACPHFEMSEPNPANLTMVYVSSRRMCALAEGFVAGAATHYGETVHFEHKSCVERGDARCTFNLTWL
jgi:hypothetical protein